MTAPANIPLSATATDRYTNIDYVAFYSGPTLIGSASNAPYGMTWSNVLNGTYTLTAQVVDLAGYAEFSAPVTVTVAPGGNSLRGQLRQRGGGDGFARLSDGQWV